MWLLREFMLMIVLLNFIVLLLPYLHLSNFNVSLHMQEQIALFTNTVDTPKYALHNAHETGPITLYNTRIAVLGVVLATESSLASRGTSSSTWNAQNVWSRLSCLLCIYFMFYTDKIWRRKGFNRSSVSLKISKFELAALRYVPVEQILFDINPNVTKGSW